MTDTIDEVFDAIALEIAQEQQDFGDKLVSVTMDRVSKPVGYRIGPRGGEQKIRSKRGEPPRRDTGALMNSIKAETISVGDKSSTAVTVNVPYGDPLENVLDRPIFEGELEATDELLLDMVTQAIGTK